jgi:MFS transporter, ACS family, tartrate transporter
MERQATIDTTSEIERRTIRKVSWRLLPLIVTIYFVAYMDRTNVSFAAFGMTRDIGLTPYIFGWGAGIFFLGYFLFEVPSNVFLAKTGARLWIARIMFTWGLVAAAMAFTVGPKSFIALRFILGVAEAGFFPGMILYFTFWFPKRYRARVIAALFLAVPGSNALTAAISGALLQLDGALGLAGWQWLYIIEALPSILLAFAVLAFLTDRPAIAKWLEPDERDWLTNEIEREQKAVTGKTGHMTLGQVLTNGRVLSLAAIYFTIVTATYGITFFLPQIVKGVGGSDLATGLITAIPYIIGTIGMVAWSYSSDRNRERKWHFIVACCLAAVSLALAGKLGATPLSLIVISIATVGLYGSKPAFWPLPSEFLSGTAAAGGIAAINSIGNLGGFVGPYALGWIKDATGSYEWALYFLAACALASAVIAYFALASREPAGQFGAVPTVRS